jgi:hypothetical protein
MIVDSSYRWSVYGDPRSLADYQGTTGDSVLPDHLTPHAKRYESIDGNCKERIPRRFFYGFLNGMYAILFGGRISYRLIVKGDDRTYFYGFIGWQLLIPFSFLVTMYGFGALMESVLYFTSPCEESHVLHNVSVSKDENFKLGHYQWVCG